MTPRDEALAALKVLNEYRGTPVHNAVLNLLTAVDRVYSDEWHNYDPAQIASKQGAAKQIKVLHQSIDSGMLDMPII